MIVILNMVIIVRAIFLEDNKYYPQILFTVSKYYHDSNKLTVK